MKKNVYNLYKNKLIFNNLNFKDKKKKSSKINLLINLRVIYF